MRHSSLAVIIILLKHSSTQAILLEIIRDILDQATLKPEEFSNIMTFQKKFGTNTEMKWQIL